MLRSWFAAFGVLWVAVAAWSFASPLGSAPDEPAHLARAASLVRGQILGTPLRHPPKALKSMVIVEVPQVLAIISNDVACFQFKPVVPAGCQKPVVGSPKNVPLLTYVGRYPPLYYALVGLPTLVMVSAKGIYAARLVSGALSAALLALAITSVRRCRGAPLLGAGLAVAMTPMVLYLAAVINPTGLEISAAVSAWAAAMALASEGPRQVSASTVAAFGGSLVVLILTRALSPAWAVLITAAFVAIGPATPLRDLLKRRYVRGWLVGCAAAGLAALAWDLFADPFLTEPGSALPPGASETNIVVMAVERLGLLVTSSIGFFGWLDTVSPYGVIVAWLAALGAVFLVGCCLARRRGAAVAIGALVAWLVVPVVVAISHARQDGILGQGRDYLGLAVGVPIVAAVVAGQRFADRRATMRFSTAVIALLAACQVVDFYGALRRNTVGSNGPLNAFATVKGVWHPAVPGPVLVVAFTLAMVAFAVLLSRAAAVQPAAVQPAAVQPAAVQPASAATADVG
jgi:hypothetical protein